MNVYEVVGRLVIAGVLDLLKGLLTLGPPRTTPARTPLRVLTGGKATGRPRSARNTAAAPRRKKR